MKQIRKNDCTEIEIDVEPKTFASSNSVTSSENSTSNSLVLSREFTESVRMATVVARVYVTLIAITSISESPRKKP